MVGVTSIAPIDSALQAKAPGYRPQAVASPRIEPVVLSGRGGATGKGLPEACWISASRGSRGMRHRTPMWGGGGAHGG